MTYNNPIDEAYNDLIYEIKDFICQHIDPNPETDYYKEDAEIELDDLMDLNLPSDKFEASKPLIRLMVLWDTIKDFNLNSNNFKLNFNNEVINKLNEFKKKAFDLYNADPIKGRDNIINKEDLLTMFEDNDGYFDFGTGYFRDYDGNVISSLPIGDSKEIELQLDDISKINVRNK